MQLWDVAQANSGLPLTFTAKIAEFAKPRAQIILHDSIRIGKPWY